jgi:hypothetical protein
MKNDGYKLTRAWFDFAYEKKEAKAIHTALYLWIVEVNNKCAWKDEFGLPTSHAMEVLSIANKKTYYDTLKDLQTFGFVTIVQESQNQFTACIVSLKKENGEVKNRSALSSAMFQQPIEQCSSTINGTPFGIVPIDKPLNIQPLNSLNHLNGENEILIDVSKNQNNVSGGWFKKATAAEFLERLQVFRNENPNNGYLEIMFQDFINYYTTPNDKNGIRLNNYSNFGFQNNLYEWKNKKEHAGKYEIKTPKKKIHYE